MSTAAGVLLVLVASRDIFDRILHPAGSGHISGAVMRATFAVLRRVSTRRPGAIDVAGPLGILFSIFTWAVMVAVGWALIYLPHIPAGFRYDSGVSVSPNGAIWDALYVSLVTLATLGYGDISPSATWLRILAPVESLLGLALLTASLTWALSVYPVLSRRRAFAHRVNLIWETVPAAVAWISRASAAVAVPLLWQLTSDVVRIRTDYLHFAGARFFHMSDPRSSLSTALLKLWRMAAAAEGGEDAKGEAGALLRKAVEELVEVMRRQPEIEAGPDTGPEEVLRRYARVHRREPLDV